MKNLLTILEAITIMAWLAVVLISLNGAPIKMMLGVILMLSGIWVVIAAILSYKNYRDESRTIDK